MKIWVILILLALSHGAYAGNVTSDYFCPNLAFVDEHFAVWLDYQNATKDDILGADVYVHDRDTLTNYSLIYNANKSHYGQTFTSASEKDWEITLYGEKAGYETFEQNCTIRIREGFNLTLRIWEEVEEKVLESTHSVVITEKNFNKVFEDPYINDFAFIIAVNLDHPTPNLYDVCRLPLPGAQSIWNSLSIPNVMHNKPNEDSLAGVKGLIAPSLGCDKYWFRAPYIQGSATIALPVAGNYTLYLVEGTIEWENAYSPPKFVKSQMTLWLGNINIQEPIDSQVDFWVSHDELDFWGRISDVVFFLSVTILPILLFVLLVMIGFPASMAGMIAIGWNVMWTIIKVLL
jgi:hypothetical protein